MPELRKFQRSKERVAEVLNYLKNNKCLDERNNSSISALERSLELIDTKMQEFEKKNLFNN
ncbi:hypothetical protein BH09BAC6_BH09BAC6_31590 [soil metagenome]|jgi:hypothetical protein